MQACHLGVKVAWLGSSPERRHLLPMMARPSGHKLALVRTVRPNPRGGFEMSEDEMRKRTQSFLPVQLKWTCLEAEAQGGKVCCNTCCTASKTACWWGQPGMSNQNQLALRGVCPLHSTSKDDFVQPSLACLAGSSWCRRGLLAFATPSR